MKRRQVFGGLCAVLGIGASANALASEGRIVRAYLENDLPNRIDYVVVDEEKVIANVTLARANMVIGYRSLKAGRAYAVALVGTYAGKGRFEFPDLDTAFDWIRKEVR